jgi:hypothetical protein
MRYGLSTKPVAPARARKLFLPAAISLLLVAASCGRYEYSLSEKKPASPAGDRAVGGDWLSALGERILPLIEEHDTQYAPGYREEVFRTLAFGVTEADVARLLGPPLLAKRFSDGNTCWYYTRHGERSASYFVRVLEFDPRCVLVARRHYFYLG